jgi:hypothetical protein
MWNLVTGIGICVLPVIFAVTVRKFWLCVLLSAIALTGLLHITSYAGVAYVDPFFLVSLPVSLVAFLFWSALIVWIVRRLRGSHFT